MKNTIRCCISCILPCGALDVIRIVHVNGHVEELTGTIRAAEIMKAHPKHVLKKPTTRPSSDVDPTFSTTTTTATANHHRPTIVVVPPDAELQRGKIYFLIPVSSSSSTAGPTKKKLTSSTSKSRSSSSSPSLPTSENSGGPRRKREKTISVTTTTGSLVVTSSDQYLSEILSEKVISTQRERRSRGRVAVWRPHLESITESLSEAASTITNDQ